MRTNFILAVAVAAAALGTSSAFAQSAGVVQFAAGEAKIEVGS